MSSEPLPLGGALELLRLVWAVDHGLQRTSRHMEQSLGITSPQRFVLRLIGRFPSVTAGQLADALKVHPSTMTGILKRLRRRGLLTRRADPHDRRRAFLALTPAGRALHVDPQGTVEGAVTQVLHDLPAHKVEAAREVLEALSQRLEEEVTGRGEGLRAG
jgi:DNA-binding MarR family transcriptional regulator